VKAEKLRKVTNDRRYFDLEMGKFLKVAGKKRIFLDSSAKTHT
jgi:hypothetical protein